MESPHHQSGGSAGGGEGSDSGGSGAGGSLETAERIILRWDSTVSEEARERMIFDGDRHEVDLYLHAVDEIQRSMESTSIDSGAAEEPSLSHHHHPHSHHPRIYPQTPTHSTAKSNNTIQIAMARLEDEFRNILLTHTSPIETESLLLDPSGSPSASTSFSHSTTDADHSSSFSPHATTKSAADFSPDYGDEAEEDEGDREAEGDGSNRSSTGVSFRRSNASTMSNYRSASSIREIELIPPEAVADLRSIAERMIAAGYLRECAQVYGSVRKSSIDTSFRNLGIEKLSIGDVQRLEWEALESKIRRWIWAAKVAVRTLFASERRLSQQIFDGLGGSTNNYSAALAATATDDACFLETVKGPAVQLFNFAEAISIGRRSPEKLFKILDLHDALADLCPDINLIFQSKAAESIRVQAAEILSRLAEAARGILSEFENAVLREPSKVPVPAGTLHPLTRYVMNYVSLISDYKATLVELIVSKPGSGSGSSSRFSGDLSLPDMDFGEEEDKTPLACHLIWIIVILEHNLEGKSQHYRDTSLAHLFMMNNVHYITQKIKGSPELREMIGDDYLKRLTGKFRISATNYQRQTLTKVLHCLREEGLHVSGSFSSGISKSVLRERFKSFNAMFEEVHRTQSMWVVPDLQLREELRISISERVIPAYRSFLGRFRSHIEGSRHVENYIKYSEEDLEAALLDFFEGNPASQHLRRRSQ